MRKITLWCSLGEGFPSRSVAEGPVALSQDGLLVAPEVDRPGMVLVLPVRAFHRVAAVALIPDGLEELGAAPLVNGVLVGPGMHLLRHADSLVLGRAALWISAQSTPEETVYDAAVHGEDVFCFRTKSRLEPGEPIVICPGTARAACGMLYKAAAWELGLPCHSCRFDPGQSAWEPPPPRKERTSVDDLLKLANS